MTDNWRGRWWNGFKRELTDIAPMSGLAGVGTGGIALIESALLSGGTVLLVICGSIGIAAYRSYPEPLTDPNSIVGQTFSPPSEIPPLSTQVPCVGVFGATDSGKSTLLRKLMNNTDKANSTRGLHATVLRTNGAQPHIFILLDGEGESPAEQSKICNAADLLFFVVDHNIGETETRIVATRKKAHLKFWNNMFTFFNDREKDVQKIHILLNKKDCWNNSASADEFQEWGKSLVNEVKLRVSCGDITVTPHSNYETDDISRVWSKIEEFVS